METLKKIIIWIVFLFSILCAFGCTKTVTQTVYQPIYPNLPDVTYPQTLRAEICKFTPVTQEPVVVGFDKENLKCYLNNQEVFKKQISLYQKKIDMINEERKEWREKTQ